MKRYEASKSWSELPSDPLTSIVKHLKDNDNDLLKSRAVCNSWRSIIAPPQTKENCPPLPFQISFKVGEFLPVVTDFVISKTTFYCLKPAAESSSANRCWLMKVREPNLGGILHVVNPFSKQPIKNLPNSFPKVMNTLNFHYKEICDSINIHRPNITIKDDVVDHEGQIHKVILSTTPCSDNEYIILCIRGGDLCCMHVSDEEWIVLDSDVPYRDIVSFNGVFFAIDMFGAISIVDQSTCEITLSDPPLGIPKGEMYFVESRGDLYIVARDLDICDQLVYYDEDIDGYIAEPGVGDEIPFKFNIYRLVVSNSEVKPSKRYKWNEVYNLGDQMFVLNKDHSFSLAAKDFPGCKGNCIYFVDDVNRPFDDDYGVDFYDNPIYNDGEEYDEEDEDELDDMSIYVYNFEDGYCGTLNSLPGYPNIFWPPPSWLSSIPSTSSSSRS